MVKGEVYPMSLETISQKQLNELERCVENLLTAMRKTRMLQDPLVESLKALEHQLGEARRKRFDQSTPEFRGF
jgi:hypothetical protein